MADYSVLLKNEYRVDCSGVNIGQAMRKLIIDRPELAKEITPVYATYRKSKTRFSSHFSIHDWKSSNASIKAVEKIRMYPNVCPLCNGGKDTATHCIQCNGLGRIGE